VSFIGKARRHVTPDSEHEEFPLAMRSNLLITALISGSLIAAAASIAQNSTAPSTAFNSCEVCHSVDGINGTGPTLKGVVGRQSGTVPGFRYSRAMKSAGITWDDKSLDRYLADPQELVPGNVMPFSGIVDGAQRAAIIAYLKTI
jgi:cytochrome c